MYNDIHSGIYIYINSRTLHVWNIIIYKISIPCCRKLTLNWNSLKFFFTEFESLIYCINLCCQIHSSAVSSQGYHDLQKINDVNIKNHIDCNFSSNMYQLRASVLNSLTFFIYRNDPISPFLLYCLRRPVLLQKYNRYIISPKKDLLSGVCFTSD